MTSDPYRGVRTISYDISDHIAKLDSDSAVVSFGYLASGVKMNRKVETSSDTVLLEYVGNVVMEDGRMKYLLVDGGYIDFTSGTPVYMYYFKDHLGSNRVVASQSGSVEQVNHYYPYGLSFPLDSHTSSGSDSSVPSAGGDDQPWKYSGNELMSLGGLSVYDFNARTYDQSLGRFLSIDPLAENYYSVSPYAFCSNNPVNFVDPDGDSLKIIDMSVLTAIYNGLAQKGDLNLVLNNGVVDPASIPENSSDWFINDLSEIVNSKQMVELDIAHNYQHQDEYGNVSFYAFSAPYDYDTNDEDDTFVQLDGLESGRTIYGNLGRTLVPMKSISMSMNSNVQIIINAKGTLNHRTVGIVHEFGHAILYLRGLSHKHTEPGVDYFIYDCRATLMSKRLGYDF